MTGEGAGLSDDHPAVELSQPSEEELAETTEETVYTSAISESRWLLKHNYSNIIIASHQILPMRELP